MIIRNIAILMASMAFSWADTPVGFETHYVNVGTGHTVALAANSNDGSMFIVAYLPSGYRVIKTDVQGNFQTRLDFGFGEPVAATVDAQGNLLLVGTTSTPMNFPATAQIVPLLGGAPAFLVKFDSNLTRITSAVLIGGSSVGASAAAVATDSTGNVYVTGWTVATDFPVTPGAFQTNAPSGAAYAFLTKLSPDLARIIYSTYFGGDRTNTPFGAHTYASAIAVNSAGEATIAGSSTANAGSGSGGSFGPLPYPFVARFSPDGSSREAYTDFNEVPGNLTAITLEDSGNTLVAGYESSSVFYSNTGFIAALGASFNSLFAVLVGGARNYIGFTAPAVQGIQVDDQGNIWITGTSDASYVSGASPANTPVAVPYIAEFSGDGSSRLDLIEAPFPTLAMTKSSGGTLAILGSPDSILLSSPTAQNGPFIVTSSANNVSSGTVAPGELVSLYGSGMGPSTGTPGEIAGGAFTNNLGGFQVLFDDIAAPLLYVGPNQINTIIPRELAFLTTSRPGKTRAAIKVVGPNGTINFPTVLVAPSHPQIFVTSMPLDVSPGAWAEATNEDGTANSASNPATAGSTVTIWATGLGVPYGADGSIVQQPSSVTVSVTAGNGSQLEVLNASNAPNSVAGLFVISFGLPLSLFVPPQKFIAIALETSDAISDYVAIHVTP